MLAPPAEVAMGAAAAASSSSSTKRRALGAIAPAAPREARVLLAVGSDEGGTAARGVIGGIDRPPPVIGVAPPGSDGEGPAPKGVADLRAWLPAAAAVSAGISARSCGRWWGQPPLAVTVEAEEEVAAPLPLPAVLCHSKLALAGNCPLIAVKKFIMTHGVSGGKRGAAAVAAADAVAVASTLPPPPVCCCCCCGMSFGQQSAAHEVKGSVHVDEVAGGREPLASDVFVEAAAAAARIVLL